MRNDLVLMVKDHVITRKECVQRSSLSRYYEKGPCYYELIILLLREKDLLITRKVFVIIKYIEGII